MNAIDKILAIMEQDDDCFAVWGIRAVAQCYGIPEAGEELANSYVWVDGEWTDEELDGVCTMGIKAANRESIETAIRNLGRDACKFFEIDPPRDWFTYQADAYVLVKGESGRSGEDKGETIIENGIAVAVFN